MSFTIFQNQKTPFQAINTTTSKSRKIDIFPKGVTHAFFPKVAIFETLFFYAIQGSKMFFYDILERKNTFLGYKNKRFKKSKNSHFFHVVNPWFWSKNGHFCNFFFQALQHGKMSLTILYNEKTPFQTIKTRSHKV